MSNIVQFNPTQLPAFARTGALSETAKALAGGGVGQTGKRVSIKGGVFRLIHDGKEVASIEDRHLDVVMVKAAPKVARIFYGKAYDSDSPAAPDCWSADGVRPDPTAKNPQANACRDCPMNAKGSGQGDTRACRFSQRIAVVLANDIGGDVLQLTVPGASVFGDGEMGKWPLRAYGRLLGSKGLPISVVVTEMRFDTDSDAPKINFRAVRVLEEAESAKTIEQGKTDAAMKAITMTVAKMDNVAAPIAIPGARPKAAPVIEEEPEAPAPKPKKAKAVAVAEEDEEPVVRKEEKKPNAVPKAKSALADMVDDWDENA